MVEMVEMVGRRHTVEPAQQRPGSWGSVFLDVPASTKHYGKVLSVRELGFSTWWDSGKSSSSFFFSSGVFDQVLVPCSPREINIFSSSFLPSRVLVVPVSVTATSLLPRDFATPVCDQAPNLPHRDLRVAPADLTLSSLPFSTFTSYPRHRFPGSPRCTLFLP